MLAVQAALPHVSPWRVVMLSDEPARLLESDLLLNLNEPCAIADPSWTQPGKTTFPWWNGYYEENVPCKPGLNTATMKYYVDFCAASGIPFHSLDGLDNTAWYGGPIVPYKGADITRALPAIDLQEVIGYAREKNVGIRLWMHWQAARAHMDRAFPLYRQWGIHGVMLDFMDRDDQEYGPARLIEHFLHPEACLNGLVEEVQRFAHGSNHTDDATAILVCSN